MKTEDATTYHNQLKAGFPLLSLYWEVVYKREEKHRIGQQAEESDLENTYVFSTSAKPISCIIDYAFLNER